MNIVGIHWSINGSVSLMMDGKLVAAVSEERFSRLKNDSRFPIGALGYVLEANGLNIGEIDVWALASLEHTYAYQLVRRYCTFSVKDYVREMDQYWYPKLFEGREPDYLDVFRDKIDRSQFPSEFWANGTNDGSDYRVAILRDHLGVAEKRIKRMEHHSCHAAYAYYTAPDSFREDDVLALTIDAIGDGLNATVTRVSPGGKFSRLYQTDLANLGRLYRFFTLMLGMKPNEHEYKLMGLAPYAKSDAVEEVSDLLAEYLWVEDGEFVQYKPFPDMYFTFRDALKHVRFDAIAGGMQHYVETVLVNWVEGQMREHGLRTVVLGGGVAMNIKAMGEILSHTEVERIHVPGTPADESNCIGAAYLASHGKDRVPSASLYLGPGAPVATALLERAHGLGFTVIEGPPVERIAQYVADYNVVGRCIGPMEFGARALGNRSIVARCDRDDVRSRINQAIKNRDFWMPFAPVILDSHADAYLVNPKGIASPYMAFGFQTTPEGRDAMRAAVHPADGSARPQILERPANPDFHDFLETYRRQTGFGCLLNTSFNLHGFPIVRTADDALDVFEKSDLDGLWLDEALITRNGGYQLSRSTGNGA